MRQLRLQRLSWIVVLLGGLTIFPSCLETKNPVSAAKAGGRDKALCGAWKYREKDGTLWLLQFGYLDGAFKSPWMCHVFSTTGGTDLSSGSTACFVSQAGGVNYLNLADDLEVPFHRMAEDPLLLDKIHKFVVVKYELKNDKLWVTTVDDDFVKSAITKGLIAGEGTFITAPSESLAAFLEKEHERVFPAKNTLEFTRL